MKKLFAMIFAAAVLPVFAPAAEAQKLDEVFRKASPAVVVVRAKGRDVTASGITRFTETGSGVLISSDGRVMTAAHVVNAMDEITVEGIGVRPCVRHSSRPMRPPTLRCYSLSA